MGTAKPWPKVSYVGTMVDRLPSTRDSHPFIGMAIFIYIQCQFSNIYIVFWGEGMSKVLKNILKKFRKKDDDAKRILFEMFHEQVRRKAYYITKDHYLAQDILQETFIKAFNNMGQLKDGGNVGAWLTTIATRTAIDFIRKQERWNDIPIENVFIEKETISQLLSCTVEAEVEQKWLKENLRCIIDELPPNFRAVIILKYIHELKDQEIAEILDENVGTVKSRIHRAKDKLKSLVLRSDALDGDSL